MASINISPASGTAGVTEFMVTGTGFAVNAVVTFNAQDSTGKSFKFPPDLKSNPGGGFASEPFILPWASIWTINASDLSNRPSQTVTVS
jgi:hypothetical protein